MFERISNGWQLTRQSWHVLRLDKELVVFPLLSGVACLLVLASFAFPLWSSGYVETWLEDEQPTSHPLAYVLLFLFYLINYFVIVFFNSALIGCAIIRFRGEDPTLADGMRAASDRLPQIFAWALVSSTVGLILRVIESRSEKAGELVAGLLGMAWSAASYFVVPVLVIEKLGPVAAAKRSLSILRHTWGEAFTGNFGIGVITLVMNLLASVPLVAGIFAISSGQYVLGTLALALGGVALILVSLVSAALHAILVAALYLFAADGTVPGPFDEALFRRAFRKD
jgi:hypothetical protein